MATICDQYLLDLMLERGHTFAIERKLVADDGSGGHTHTWPDRIVSIVGLIEDIQSVRGNDLSRMGEKATHILYLPISVDAVETAFDSVNERIKGLTPAELLDRVWIASEGQGDVTTPYDAAGVTEGRHIEAYLTETRE